MVSVVIPVLNGEEHIAEQLEAVSRQTYGGAWEVLVVDNGCTDRTIPIVESWRDRLPQLRVVDARARRSLNHARNRGAEEARGEFIAFCDSDDVVSPEWLEALVEAGADADLVAGMEEPYSLNTEREQSWRPTDPHVALKSTAGFLPWVSGGNCGIWADVARSVVWDESFTYGSSDIEFSWRAQLASYRVAFAPRAVMSQRYRQGLRPLMRQYYRYGKSDPQLYRRYRRHGMRRDDLRVTLRKWKRLARRAPDLLRSQEGRGDWLRIAARTSGRMVGSIRWRVFYP